jgi:hypothetical protein
VKDGKIVSPSPRPTMMVWANLLAQRADLLDDYTRVSKLVTESAGALLVAEGVLEPKDLVPAVVGQVRAVILGLFRRTETWYGFKEEELARKESITLDMPVAQLVLEGVQLVDSWRRISKGVGDLDSVYQVAGATEVEWSRLRLESEPTELLTLLSSPMRIADVCAETSIDDFDACRYLWAFRSLAWIERADISVDDAAEIAEQAEMAEMTDMADPFPRSGRTRLPAPVPDRDDSHEPEPANLPRSWTQVSHSVQALPGQPPRRCRRRVPYPRIFPRNWRWIGPSHRPEPGDDGKSRRPIDRFPTRITEAYLVRPPP